MRILAVTNMYPTSAAPTSGIYIDQQIKGLKDIGVEVETLFLDRFKRGMSVYLNARREIKMALETFQPDLVHVMYGGILADLVTRNVRDRPTVVTFHGSDLLGEHLDGYLRKLLADWGVRASHRAAKRASGVIAVSRQLQDKLPIDVDPGKVRVIPCGIDLDLFKPCDPHKCRVELGWAEDSFHILFASNFYYPVKRPELARAAFEATKELGIKCEFHYMSGIAYREVSRWLNASDVLLLTSLHEGSPTIIKEALACMLPIVSVDVGDVRDRIRDISECYLAAADPRDLANKLAKVYSLGRRIVGQTKVEEFSLQRVAVLLKQFYKELEKTGTK